MPIKKRALEDKKRARFFARPLQKHLALLREYVEWADEDLDSVVDEMINQFIKPDKAFAEWKESPDYRPLKTKQETNKAKQPKSSGKMALAV